MDTLKRLGLRWVLGMAVLMSVVSAESCRIALPGENIRIDFDNDKDDDFFDDLDEFFEDLDD